MTRNGVHACGDCFAGIPREAWKEQPSHVHVNAVDDCLGADIHLADNPQQAVSNQLSCQPSGEKNPASCLSK